PESITRLHFCWDEKSISPSTFRIFKAAREPRWSCCLFSTYILLRKRTRSLQCACFTRFSPTRAWTCENRYIMSWLDASLSERWKANSGRIRSSSHRTGFRTLAATMSARGRMEPRQSVAEFHSLARLQAQRNCLLPVHAMILWRCDDLDRA